MRQVNVHDCVQFFQRVYNSYYLYFLYFFLSIISYFLIYQGSAIHCLYTGSKQEKKS